MNQTQYNRVLSLDSDSTVLQCLDELFLLPPSPVAMPRAYWEWDKKQELSSQLLLLETNAVAFARIMRAVENADAIKFDMDILNDLYFGSATVLPHRQYDLLTGEFNGGPKDHSLFTGDPEEVWDPEQVLRDAKFVHFSDWPIPKVRIPVQLGRFSLSSVTATISWTCPGRPRDSLCLTLFSSDIIISLGNSLPQVPHYIACSIDTLAYPLSIYSPGTQQRPKPSKRMDPNAIIIPASKEIYGITSTGISDDDEKRSAISMSDPMSTGADSSMYIILPQSSLSSA